MADASVDLICSSPPYWSLRAYTDGGVHYPGQIGSEATPAEFIDNLIAATREMVRVLRPGGSIFINLGDKYSGAQAQNVNGQSRAGDSAKVWERTNPKNTGIPAKSLMLLPERYRIRCVDELGLIARAVIIWGKPNGLPESVTDRVRRSHEDWVHFTREPRYFSAVDEIREPQMEPDRQGSDRSSSRRAGAGLNNWDKSPIVGRDYNPLGKLPGSVWTIPTQPLTVPPELGVDHFAAFPMEWPRRIIQGWSPAGVCTGCGEGRRPQVGYDGPHDMAPVRVLSPAQTAEWCARFAGWCRAFGVTRGALDEASGTNAGTRWFGDGGQPRVPTADHWSLLRRAWPHIPEWFDEYVHTTELRPVRGGNYTDKGGARKGPVGFTEKATPIKMLAGYACGCPEPTAPTRPAVILDPFGGTGTTALVAKALGRDGISVDMSADYCRLAAWRCNDPGQMAAALQVERPDPVSPDQLDLFSEAL